MTTPKLQLPELVVGQPGKELTHNQALAILSQLTQANVIDKDLTAPPASPADGAMYLVAISATGAWLGKDGQLAFWLTSVAAWTFAVPANGWRVWVADEAEYYKLKAGAWIIDTSGGGSGMTNPMTTAGDIVVGGASGAPARLAKGTDGQVLKMVSGAQAWAAESVGLTNPMTTVGDLVVGSTSGTPARLAASTSTYVLTSNGAGVAPTWQAPASGGGGALTNFSESKNTATPNLTTPAVSLTVSVTESSGDAVLSAKGNGATLAHVPDSTTTGGNKRGVKATDLQKERNSATQVASGNYATLIGGNNNLASGLSSLAAGASSTASGANSVAIGNEVIASSADSVSLGRGSMSRAMNGVSAFASRASAGDAQVRSVVLAKTVTNSTPLVITSDNSTANATNQLDIPIRSALLVRGRCVAHNQSSNDTKAWSFDAVLKRTTGGTVSLVSAVTPTVIAADSGASAWALDVAADDTLKALKVTVTGASSGSTRFACLIESTEVTT